MCCMRTVLAGIHSRSACKYKGQVRSNATVRNGKLDLDKSCSRKIIIILDRQTDSMTCRTET